MVAADRDHGSAGQRLAVPFEPVTHDGIPLRHRAVRKPDQAAVWLVATVDQQTEVEVEGDQDTRPSCRELEDGGVARVRSPTAAIDRIVPTGADPLRQAAARAPVDEEAHGSADSDLVERFPGDFRVRMGQAGVDVLGLERRVVLEDLRGGDTLASRLSTNSTEMRIRRMIGLPPKMSGLEVMRSRSPGSTMTGGESPPRNGKVAGIVALAT